MLKNCARPLAKMADAATADTIAAAYARDGWCIVDGVFEAATMEAAATAATRCCDREMAGEHIAPLLGEWTLYVRTRVCVREAASERSPSLALSLSLYFSLSLALSHPTRAHAPYTRNRHTHMHTCRACQAPAVQETQGGHQGLAGGQRR